jgi:ferredoxin
VPKITFVNEHRVVEVESGRNVRDVAREAGVALDVSRFQGLWSCGGRGVCRACMCWVEESSPGAAGPRSTMEKLRGLKGWRRLACRTRVTGDVKVFTMPAAGNRVGGARPIDAAPTPTVDATAARKPVDAAGTAEFVRGHPSMIGRGVVPPAKPAEEASAKPASAKSAAAKPALSTKKAPSLKGASAKPAEHAKPAEDAKPGESARPVEDAGAKAESAKPVEGAAAKAESARPVEDAAAKAESAKPVEDAAAKAESARPVEDAGAKPESAKPVEDAAAKAESARPVEDAGAKAESAKPVEDAAAKPASPANEGEGAKTD